MTELESHLERVVNFNVQVREEGDHVVFLHRLAPGSADQSYGINVAQMAGMPTQVVARAQEILARLEKDQIDTTDIHRPETRLHRPLDPNSTSSPRLRMRRGWRNCGTWTSARLRRFRRCSS